jgi:hypothetical protein
VFQAKLGPFFNPPVRESPTQGPSQPQAIRAQRGQIRRAKCGTPAGGSLRLSTGSAALGAKLKGTQTVQRYKVTGAGCARHRCSHLLNLVGQRGPARGAPSWASLGSSAARAHAGSVVTCGLLKHFQACRQGHELSVVRPVSQSLPSVSGAAGTSPRCSLFC